MHLKKIRKILKMENKLLAINPQQCVEFYFDLINISCDFQQNLPKELVMDIIVNATKVKMRIYLVHGILLTLQFSSPF